MSLERELTRNRKVDAALENERVTRSRVDLLERQVKSLHDRLAKLEQEAGALRNSGPGVRLKWLVRGK